MEVRKRKRRKGKREERRSERREGREGEERRILPGIAATAPGGSFFLDFC